MAVLLPHEIVVIYVVLAVVLNSNPSRPRELIRSEFVNIVVKNSPLVVLFLQVTNQLLAKGLYTSLSIVV